MLVLASNSPRRKQLLALGGWAFSVLPAEVDERVQAGESPGAYVRRLASGKARAARETSGEAADEVVFLAADTAVVDIARGAGKISAYEILGKPVDAADADRMLRRLRGRVHQVYTGLAVLGTRDEDQQDDSGFALRSEVVVTDVPMRDYTDTEMAAYIASGDPFDKAGAYAIQSPTFKPVEKLAGCYANVMGLPVCHLSRILAQFGVYPEVDLAAACQEKIDFACPIFERVLGVGA